MEGMAHPAVSLGALWLPILLATLFTFIGSMLVWTVFHYHDGDWKVVPDEAGLLEALRKAGLASGQYMFPHMDPKAPDKKAAQKTWEERYAQGPVGALLVGTPGRVNMGKNMGLMVAYFLVVSFFIAYIASHALPHGATYLQVFQIVGATAFVAYGSAQFVDSIWFHRSWRSTWLNVADALLYACLTAGTFGWLWPR